MPVNHVSDFTRSRDLTPTAACNYAELRCPYCGTCFTGLAKRRYLKGRAEKVVSGLGVFAEYFIRLFARPARVCHAPNYRQVNAIASRVVRIDLFYLPSILSNIY